VRMNTASEEVLRTRSTRGSTLLYDLRFRRNTVHCVAKFGSLLGMHALKTSLRVVAMCSVALTNGLFDPSNSAILPVSKIQGRRRAIGSKLSYYIFDLMEAQDAAVQLQPCLSFRLFRSSNRCTNEKVKAAAGADPLSSV
jgi:hypothetical protein